MSITGNNKGFSLTEVLLAVAILTIGMSFVSGTFLAGVFISTISSEQTIAAVVADEAYAKIRLFGINPADPNIAVDHLMSFNPLHTISADEFAYPSTKVSTPKQYYWSALCRAVGSGSADRLIQVTVFVSRMSGGGQIIYPGGFQIPTPVQVGVTTAGSQKLTIIETDKLSYINDGYTIVDDRTGQLYRVIQRSAQTPDIIELDRYWQGNPAQKVWVIPPPLNSNSNPCIAVYQKVMRF
jgi:prepilin-type N-terminal cleavage/methylation domain-containing protein